MDFQEDLKKSIFNADEKIDKKELLKDIFKSFVAKMFEHVLSRKGNDRLPFDVLVTVKKNLINEFRSANLSEHQQTEQWYNDLFEDTVREIFNEASLSHQGQDIIQRAPQNFEINMDTYKNEGGLFIPK